MKQPEHFFDPALEELYTRQFTDCGITWKENNAEIQALLYQLNQSELHLNTLPKAYGFIQYQLELVTQSPTTEIISDYSLNKLLALQVTKISPGSNHLCTDDNINLCLNQSAVVMLTQPCWLQNISPAIASQTFISMQLMSIYRQLSHKGHDSIDLQQSYRALLLATGSKIPNLHSHHFSQQTEHIPALFELATIQLALSRFPRVFLPEILGFTLAYCQAPTPVEACFPDQHTCSLFFQQRQHQLSLSTAPLQQCIAAYLALFPQQTQILWVRIQQGFWLYQLQMQRGCKQFTATLNVSLSAHQAVSKLLRQKAVSAIGHHQKIQLQGRSLDSWFAELPANTGEFLQALIQSDYVDQQNPTSSPLLGLFDFNGPMFGVLDKSEREILLNWLQDKRPTSPKTPGAAFSHNTTSLHADPKTISTSKINTGYLKTQIRDSKPSNRELYYYLVNLDLFPEVLPTAKHKIRKLLRACALFNSPPFKLYNHQKFNRYIENIYQREIKAYTPLKGAPKISKEAYIWGFEQIAPMILIDGCWIQNSLTLQNFNPEISDILFSIYTDEIGCGKLQHNHPYIFQQLLNSVSIDIPPAYSRDFIEHSGFINSAFDLPVYMLALSSFSVEFLPELLGLNMAIELSGLGKSYQGLVDDWKYWGIDPSIANIHISIDNYGSGHTFLAKKAIHIYMDTIMQNSSNTTVLNDHWRRIYNGYASLRFVGGRFKLGLPFHYLIHKFRLKEN